MIEVILDVDTGVDDALAILFAARHPGLHLRAVSCVAGNTDVDQVVANTLRVLDAAGAGHVPVARGAESPLLEPLRHAHHVHGDDGMGETGLPLSKRKPTPEHAIELLRREIMSSPEPVTLITLAPLTNIAMLLKTFPEVTHQIGRVITMGGSASVGNVTPVAEFNIWHDPEAAALVFGTGLPMLMYGLDVFYGPAVSRTAAEKLAANPEPGARLAGQLMLHLSDRFGTETRLGELGGAGLGDAGAVCVAVDPVGLVTSRLPVAVELNGALTRGQTVVDHRTAFVDLAESPRTEVALGIDGPRYRDLYLSTILLQR